MVTRRTRKESGRKYNKFYDPEEGEYNGFEYDDWIDYRDGQRDFFKDKTKLQPKNIKKGHWGFQEFENFNKKLKKLLKRRKRMKKVKKLRKKI